jgi:hypothetical protein
MTNLVPRRYRGVSIAKVDVPLTSVGLRDHFIGREAYRRTEYIVARRAEETAVVRVRKDSDLPLFSPIVEVEMLSAPDETAFVHAPDADTAVPTQLARVAAGEAPGFRCVVVQGRYEHISFILDPAPIRLRVVEVVPPQPAKLFDQVERVLDLAEELPPIQIQAEIIDLLKLVHERPADRYLFPCRGSGAAPPGTEVSYLDERPPRTDWVLVGCARSREIHRHFYGDDAPCIEMCPRELAGDVDGPTLTKCCLLEDRVEREGALVVVPWGASLAEVKEGLGAVVAAAEPTWAPA